ENSYIGFKGRGICRWPPFGKASARSVKKKLPNNWGVYDMLGNVWEWCLNSSYDTTNKDVEKGVRRGGSWKTGAKWCQSAVRSKVFACLPLSDTGFRVVLAPTHPDKACPKAPVVIVPIEDEKSDNKAYVKTHNENEKVQLWEDGPYWATKNIGAEKPEDYGYYFWWGDTVGYKRVDDRWVASDGSASNFKFRSSNTPTCGKSVSDLRSEGWITADGVLSPQHDAAQKHWGGDWRMPTKMELEDLDSKCDWCRTQVNGVNGHVVRGKGVYSSKSIFLPCADYGYGALFDNAGSSGNYWSSVPCSDNSAWFLESGSGGYRRTYGNSRDYGRSVRPLQGFTK
ncbi:MAG: SUMF1/EgtB/PvdO family nonheme iron enzyme, partial [Kiritimatiellae bacterium]|nr:SUMF1/EgtB/PvdO family nonheme iron enzyme [Kiritimatiellia bacterium]